MSNGGLECRAGLGAQRRPPIHQYGEHNSSGSQPSRDPQQEVPSRTSTTDEPAIRRVRSARMRVWPMIAFTFAIAARVITRGSPKQMIEQFGVYFLNIF